MCRKYTYMYQPCTNFVPLAKKLRRCARVLQKKEEEEMCMGLRKWVAKYKVLKSGKIYNTKCGWVKRRKGHIEPGVEWIHNNRDDIFFSFLRMTSPIKYGILENNDFFTQMRLFFKILILSEQNRDRKFPIWWGVYFY